MTREQFISHVEQSQKAFRRFLLALCCGDSMLADDIAQESLIKAYLSCDTFNNSEKFNAWIFRIGYNTFISHTRTRRISVDYDSVTHPAAQQQADSAFQYQDLYAALHRLPEAERTAVLFHYLEGYAIKEIADIVGSSPEAVKQQLFRARRHLYDILSPTR